MGFLDFITGYASKLKPKFKKNELLEQVNILSKELDVVTIPAYGMASVFFSPNKVESPEFGQYSKKYFSLIGGSNNKGMINDIGNRLDSLKKTLGFIEQQVEKDFEISIVVDGITLKKVSLIKCLELLSFISRYSLRFLNYMYICETAAAFKDSSYISEQISKGDIKELDNFLSDFVIALKSFSKDPEKFIKDIEDLPDVTVGPNSEATLANLGSTRLDPNNIFNVKGFSSIVYRFSMFFAEGQVARYKETKELKTNLELRKLYLESLIQSGQKDETIQKEIDIIQSRIDRCAEQIRKEEEKVGM